jgi:hypothetical protein
MTIGLTGGARSKFILLHRLLIHLRHPNHTRFLIIIPLSIRIRVTLLTRISRNRHPHHLPLPFLLNPALHDSHHALSASSISNPPYPVVYVHLVVVFVLLGKMRMKIRELAMY